MSVQKVYCHVTWNTLYKGQIIHPVANFGNCFLYIKVFEIEEIFGIDKIIYQEVRKNHLYQLCNKEGQQSVSRK